MPDGVIVRVADRAMTSIPVPGGGARVADCLVASLSSPWLALFACEWSEVGQCPRQPDPTDLSLQASTE